jgi:hypothetical protein
MVLDGPEFINDDKAVYLKLKVFCLATPAWEWICEFHSKMGGQSVMEALREHYEGAGEITKRVTVARATLSNTNYRNEYAYTFERFATRMKAAFAMLEKHSEPYAEWQKSICCVFRFRWKATSAYRSLNHKQWTHMQPTFLMQWHI